MKKFVVLESIGTWEKRNGKVVIDCTVKAQVVAFESNDWLEAFNESRRLEYSRTLDKEGYWHSYSPMKRAAAKRLL